MAPIFNNGRIVGYRSLRFKPSRTQVDEANKRYADMNAGRIGNPFKQGKVKTLLGQIKLRQKFTVSALLAVLMFAVPTSWLITHINKDIASAAMEKRGLEYVRETIKLVQLMQYHSGLSTVVLSGDESRTGVWETNRNEANEQVKAVEAVNSRLSEFGLTEFWIAIRSDWKQLAADISALDVKTSATHHTELIEKSFALNRKLTDASGLALDPEIDTYYMMAVAINQLPDMTELLGQLRARGIAVLIQKTITLEDTAVLQQLIGMLRKSQAMIEESASKITGSNEILRVDKQKMANDTDEIVKLTEEKIIKTTTLAFPGTAFFDAVTEAVNLRFSASENISIALDKALDDRIQHLNARKHTLLAVVLSMTLFLSFPCPAWECNQSCPGGTPSSNFYTRFLAKAFRAWNTI